MQLRWSDEPLRPRFELELSRRRRLSGHQGSRLGAAVVKAAFERKSDDRRFALQSGAWFDGAPGWHIDTNEGIARPLEERVTPAWLQRLWRTPQIQYPLDQLPYLLSEAIPRIAAEIGAELPSISEVADEIELPPSFKLRAFGELIEAHVQLSVAYGDTELEVRADGMSPPIVVLPAHRARQEGPLRACERARPARGRRARPRAGVHARRGRQRPRVSQRRRDSLLDRGPWFAPRRLGVLRPRRPRRRRGPQGRRRRPRARLERRRLARAQDHLRRGRGGRSSRRARAVSLRGAQVRPPRRRLVRQVRCRQGA